MYEGYKASQNMPGNTEEFIEKIRTADEAFAEKWGELGSSLRKTMGALGREKWRTH